MLAAVASGCYPVPEQEEVVPKVFLEVLDALAVSPWTSLIGLHFLVYIPHHPFGDGEWLRRVRGFLPRTVDPGPRLNDVAPRLLRLSPASPLLRATPPLGSGSILAPSRRPRQSLACAGWPKSPCL